MLGEAWDHCKSRWSDNFWGKP